MAKPEFNKERATIVLLEAIVSGNKNAAKKFGVSLRSVQGWKKRLDADPEFASFFALKKAKFDAAWEEDAPSAIRAAVRYILEAAQLASRSNPKAIHAVAGALKIVADVVLTKRVIDAGFAKTDKDKGAFADGMDAESAERPAYTN